MSCRRYFISYNEGSAWMKRESRTWYQYKLLIIAIFKCNYRERQESVDVMCPSSQFVFQIFFSFYNFFILSFAADWLQSHQWAAQLAVNFKMLFSRTLRVPNKSLNLLSSHQLFSNSFIYCSCVSESFVFVIVINTLQHDVVIMWKNVWNSFSL